MTTLMELAAAAMATLTLTLTTTLKVTLTTTATLTAILMASLSRPIVTVEDAVGTVLLVTTTSVILGTATASRSRRAAMPPMVVMFRTRRRAMLAIMDMAVLVVTAVTVIARKATATREAAVQDTTMVMKPQQATVMTKQGMPAMAVMAGTASMVALRKVVAATDTIMGSRMAMLGTVVMAAGGMPAMVISMTALALRAR